MLSWKEVYKYFPEGSDRIARLDPAWQNGKNVGWIYNLTQKGIYYWWLRSEKQVNRFNPVSIIYYDGYRREFKLSVRAGMRHAMWLSLKQLD